MGRRPVEVVEVFAGTTIVSESVAERARAGGVHSVRRWGCSGDRQRPVRRTSIEAVCDLNATGQTATGRGISNDLTADVGVDAKSGLTRTLPLT